MREKLSRIYFIKNFQSQLKQGDLILLRRADFIVEGKILVELKEIIQLEDVHIAQVLIYLKAYKLEVGLLINFGSKSLTFKRLVIMKTKSVESINQYNP